MTKDRKREGEAEQCGRVKVREREDKEYESGKGWIKDGAATETRKGRNMR